MTRQYYTVVAHDWINLEFVINDLSSRVTSQELFPTSSPTFTGISLTTLSVSGTVTFDTALTVPSGGTGLSTITDHGIMLGSGVGAITPLGVAANGQIPIGSAGADPVLAEITGTANQITSTAGAGTITLSLPQDIHTGASPTFAGLTVTNAAVLGSDSVVFQPNADSTTFLQVLDADGGTPVFDIDTTNERVMIGGNNPTVELEVAGDILASGDIQGATLTRNGVEIDNGYLAIGGSNANQHIDIQGWTLSTTGSVNAGFVRTDNFELIDTSTISTAAILVDRNLATVFSKEISISSDYTYTGSEEDIISMSFSIDDARQMQTSGSQKEDALDNWRVVTVRTSGYDSDIAYSSFTTMNIFMSDSGVYTNDEGFSTITDTGQHFRVYARPEIIHDGGGIDHYVTGSLVDLDSRADLSGMVDPTLLYGFYYGYRVTARGLLDNGWTNFYAFHNNVDGATHDWNLYNESTSSNWMGEDASLTYFGTGKDASIRYNGTNFIINPKEVGSGYLNVAGILMVDTSIGINEPAPATLLELTNAAPYITLHNSTHGDADGGRESRIIAKGEQSGGEETTLGYEEWSHDGASDDEKGQKRWYANAGSDGDTPTLALKLDSGGNFSQYNGTDKRYYDVGNSNYVGFKAPALTGNQVWSLPTTDGNAREFLQTDASGNLGWADPALCDITSTIKTANSMTVTTGTLSSGTVSDTQTWGDGNEVVISEVTSTPGFDVRFTFTSVTDFCRIGIAGYYDGSHHCEIQVYDDTNATWRVLWTFNDGSGHNYRFSDLPVPVATRQADYINSSNEVLIRFYHPITGNASHDLFIDYVSIIGS